ncbi:MAG: hypothetical protein QM804_14515 [Propionicimonas sp.]
MVVVLMLETLTPGVSWSPYYKVTTEDVEGGMVLITVNGVPHQLLAPAAWKLEQGEKIYGTPYQRWEGKLGNVLVVGAGSGSDVAIALAEGAEHVDAVDIDPRILQIGAERNPDRAYDDPRVSVHVNDGRAFLQSTDTRVRPDPVRAAGFAGAGQRRLADPAGVVPVHRRGDGLRPGAPQPGWGVRDVQLLPRAVADRPAGRDRRGGLRARPLRRPVRRRAGGGHGGGRPGQPALRGELRTVRPGDRRHPPTTRPSCTTPAVGSRRSTCGRWAASC